LTLLWRPVLHAALQGHGFPLGAQSGEQAGRNLDLAYFAVLARLQAPALVAPRALHEDPAALPLNVT